MEIVGAEGVLRIPSPFRPRSASEIFLKRGDKEETIKIKGGELYRGEVEDMHAAILLGKAPRVSLEDSRGNIQTILALLESARMGKSVLI
jgi:predicted dehydrogenase